MMENSNGIIKKTYRKSWFEVFGVASPYANGLLKHIPFDNDEKPIVVIQVMVTNDQQCIAEIMYEKDFNEMFEAQTFEPTTSIKASFFPEHFTVNDLTDMEKKYNKQGEIQDDRN